MPRSLSFLEDSAGKIDVLHERALGDLHGDQFRVDVRPLDHGQDRFREVFFPELDRGKIDGHRDRRISLVQPGADLRAHRIRDPLADLDDQARVLEHGNELVRGNDALVRAVPPDEGLHAHQLLGMDVPVGLIVEHELPVLVGVEQALVDRDELHGLDVHVPGVELVIVPPLLLRFRKRDIGVLHQVVGVLAVVGIDGDADRGGQHDVLAPYFYGDRDGLHDLFDDEDDVAASPPRRRG